MQGLARVRRVGEGRLGRAPRHLLAVREERLGLASHERALTRVVDLDRDPAAKLREVLPLAHQDLAGSAARPRPDA